MDFAGEGVRVARRGAPGPDAERMAARPAAAAAAPFAPDDGPVVAAARQALDEQRQRALVDEFFSGVKSGRVVLLEPGVGGAGKAEVTSALPLSADEQATIKTDLTGRGASEVAFRVDPRILGGLVVRVGDRVVDASVSGQLESLKQSLS